MLAIDLAPERYLPLVLSPQLLDIHAKELRVDRIHANLDQVRINIGNVPVRVKKDKLACAMDYVAVLFVQRLEDGLPLPVRDQQAFLRSPVIHKRNAVHIGLNPHLEFAQEERVDHLTELAQLGRPVSKIEIQVLTAPQKLHPFKGPHGGPGQHKTVRLGTATVHLAEIGFL